MMGPVRCETAVSTPRWMMSMEDSPRGGKNRPVPTNSDSSLRFFISAPKRVVASAESLFLDGHSQSDSSACLCEETHFHRRVGSRERRRDRMLVWNSDWTRHVVANRPIVCFCESSRGSHNDKGLMRNTIILYHALGKPAVRYPHLV